MVTVPTNCGLPGEAGGVTGVNGTVTEFHTAVVAKPEPGGRVTVGPAR